jgi:hypothetical protein
MLVIAASKSGDPPSSPIARPSCLAVTSTEFAEIPARRSARTT